jgi:Domain of unknown function (DUF4126)
VLIAELLAILSAASAGGLRLALPLLLISLLYGDKLWAKVPILSHLPPPLILSGLISWSIFELVISTSLLGQRVLQVTQLLLSPLIGAILGIAVARFSGVATPVWVIGLVSGLLALVLQLVQIGWFYRLGKLSLWMILAQDLLCLVLVLFAIKAPEQGGLIALLLLWLAIRSSKDWQQAYVKHRRKGRYQEPD